MAKALDKIIVVDVESTCWDLPNGGTPPGQWSDIIEIGVCLLDIRTLERSEKGSIIIKPERSTVSEFCTRLTTITQEQVDAGVSFADACKLLAERYQPRGRGWASWGDYDRKQIARNCQDFGVQFPFGPTHTNVKNRFATDWMLSREVGVPEAVRRMGLKFEGTPHRGVDDAWAIAEIYATLLAQARAGRTK